MPVTILGIESSCDETSAAIIQDNKVLSNIIANQTVHQNYGGVVPELASRAHQKNIIPVVKQAIDNANIAKKDIDAIAYTKGPGLLGSLTVTVEEASTWEIQEGLQFPHFIKAQCEFKHIGKYVPASKSKHYDLLGHELSLQINS